MVEIDPTRTKYADSDPAGNDTNGLQTMEVRNR